jgi:hypothetical protein
MFRGTSIFDRAILNLDISEERSLNLGFAETTDWQN